MSEGYSGALSQMAFICPFLPADGPASSISQEDRAPTPSPEPPPKAGLEPASTEVKVSCGDNRHLCNFF